MPDKKKRRKVELPLRYILAPMVGASEPAFRILCRNYGADLCYSPMLSVDSFLNDKEYRQEHFPTTPADRPVVCHVACNDPKKFASAAQRAEQMNLSMLDLNLGCPQRTAFLGHFGSYLMDEHDLIRDMIQTATKVSSIPISIKIRLLPTLDETIRFCTQLATTTNVAVIAIHARHRASWERKGPGARDGPADLNQVKAVQQALDGYPVRIVTNGNTITGEEVQSNLEHTQADGLMSAEGLLDNPSLYLCRYEKPDEVVSQWKLNEETSKILDKLWKAARNKVKGEDSAKVPRYEKKLKHTNAELVQKQSPLSELRKTDNVQLAREYLDLASVFPTSMRTVIFHVRRMIRETLLEYQLLEECLSAPDLQSVRVVVAKIEYYRKHPKKYKYDAAKAETEKMALERKKIAEGKRKAYEERMMRKAKREGKELHHYLSIGSETPSSQIVRRLRSMKRADALNIWKKEHGQHCLQFHLDGKCARERACAFLHVQANDFAETDELAG